MKEHVEKVKAAIQAIEKAADSLQEVVDALEELDEPQGMVDELRYLVSNPDGFYDLKSWVRRLERDDRDQEEEEN